MYFDPNGLDPRIAGFLKEGGLVGRLIDFIEREEVMGIGVKKNVFYAGTVHTYKIGISLLAPDLYMVVFRDEKDREFSLGVSKTATTKLMA